MSELYEHSAADLARMLATEKVSAEEVARSFIVRTQEVEPQVGAFLRTTEERTLDAARASDVRRRKGEARGPLDGVPVAIKDLIAEKGEKLTCASRMLENFVSPYDATVMTRLRDGAGAIPWGRLNMDEFAMGSSTENSAFGTTKNPWDLARIPGGSSGGSAAAIAAAEAPCTLGSDTGGSIRQPAALCGVVGLKPTYGLVSRFGLVAFASSLDQIGPLGRTVEDCALLLQAIAGHDGRDSTSYKITVPDYAAALEEKPRGWKLGIPTEFFGEGLGDGVRARVDEAIAWYQGQGCEMVEVSLPHTDLAVPTYYILAPAEASSNLARYDGVRYGHRSAKAADAVDMYFHSRAEGFGPEVKRRIILGTYVLSSGYYDAYYLRAQKVRTLIRGDYLKAFEMCDAVLTPTTPTPAFKAGEKSGDPLAMYLSDIYTIAANLAGLPAMSVPCGFAQEEGKELPVGFQLIGKPFEEAPLLQIAHAYDREHRYGLKLPAL